MHLLMLREKMGSRHKKLNGKLLQMDFATVSISNQGTF